MADNVVPGAGAVVPKDITQNVDPRLISMFVKPEGLVGVQSTYTHLTEPVRPPAPTDQDYTFVLPMTASAYIDLKNTELYVKGSLTKKNGEKTETTDTVLLTNNALYSLFDSATIYIGNNQAEIYVPNHPYKAFIRQMKRNAMIMTGERRNQGLLVDMLNPIFKGDAYQMGEGRKDWVMGSKTVEFMGPLLLDFFYENQSYLMPACPVKIKLRRSREPFYVTTGAENAETEYAFDIKDIALSVPCINVSPALTPLLEMQSDFAPARYDFEGLDMRQFDVPTDTITRKFRRVYEGHLPKRVIVAFYDQTAFSGQRDKAPLSTFPVDMRQITLSMNGVAVRELNTNFGQGEYTEAYRKFTEWMGLSDKQTSIPYDVYSQGHRYFCFDLYEKCPPLTGCGDETVLQGFIDVGITLGAALKTHCVMCVFCETPETVEITKDRAARHIKTIV